MKKLILLLMTVFSTCWTYGQICGTPHPANPRVYSSSERARGASSAHCIDVFFHIVRNTNGTNAFTLPNTDAIVRELNDVYSPHNIVINNAGMNFINDTELLVINTNNGEESTLFETQNQSDFINFYIVDRFTNANLVGKAQNIPSRNLVMRDNDVLTNVSAHELGHCLNLYHTHQSGGDLVNDTPNDPGLGTHNVNTTCQYTGVGGFNPLTNNIMSYSRINCLTNFTNGQGERMRTALALESVLDDITSNSCVRITSLDYLCSDEETISLSNLGTVTTTWTSSPNVRIASRTNSRATIKANSNQPNDNGWVRATLSNGIVLTETFEVDGTVNASGISLYASSYRLNNQKWNIVQAWYNGRMYNDPDYRWEFQVPSSYVRQSWSSYSYIHVRPNTSASSIYIRVRACNDCECSGWKGRWFTIRQSNSGSGGDGSGGIIEY